VNISFTKSLNSVFTVQTIWFLCC